MMSRVFRDQLQSTDDLTLKYKDEDGDLITLFDSADLAAAIAYSRVLKLTLFVNGKMVRGSKNVGAGVDCNVIKELRNIRDRVNVILDVLGDESLKNEGNNLEETASSKQDTNKVNGHDFYDGKSIQDLKLESKEFDPLQRPGREAPTPSAIPDDQQSVSSAASASASKTEVSAPSTNAMTPAPPVVQSTATPTPVASSIASPHQSYPGYPGYPSATMPGQQAIPYPNFPGYPQQVPQQHQHQQHQVQQQPPQQLQPQQQQQHAVQPGQHPGAPQMSAFVGFPQQPSAGAVRPASTVSQSSTPAATPTTAPQPHYTPAQRMPMPANPYGMGPRGPNLGYNRYPAPGQGYQ